MLLTLRKFSISKDETFDRSEVSEAGGGKPSGLAGSLPEVAKENGNIGYIIKNGVTCGITKVNMTSSS